MVRHIRNRAAIGVGTLALTTLFTLQANAQDLGASRPPARPLPAENRVGQVMPEVPLSYLPNIVQTEGGPFSDSQPPIPAAALAWKIAEETPTVYEIEPSLTLDPFQEIASENVRTPVPDSLPETAPVIEPEPVVAQTSTEVSAETPAEAEEKAAAPALPDLPPFVPDVVAEVEAEVDTVETVEADPLAAPASPQVANRAEKPAPMVTAPGRADFREEAVADLPLVTPDVPEDVSETAPEEMSIITSDITETSFAQMRSDATEKASAEGTGAEERLEVVRVLLGGLFLPEARHAAETVRSSEGRFSPSQEKRLAEMERMIAALSGDLPDQDEPETSPWASAAGTPPSVASGSGLWGLIPAVRSGKVPTSETVREAAASLGQHSAWIGAAVIPDLFNAALLANDPDLASDILSAAEAGGGVDPARMLLMRGKLAERQGDEEAAFDLYAEAMGHGTIAGVEARIAFSDMVMSRGTPGALPGLRDVLTTGVMIWRNDDYSRRLMTRLAAVTEEIGDTEGAIRVMARIVAEYPGTEEARLAEARVPVLLSDLQEGLASGDVSIEAYISLVRELSWKVEGGPEWITTRVVLAETLAERGLNAAAAAEFEAIRDRHANQVRDSASLRNRVILGEAAARIASGDSEGAQRALRTPLAGDDPQEKTRRDTLFVQAGIAMDMPQEPSSAQNLEILRARDLILKGEEEAAARFYDNFAERGKDLPREDASRYILARSRTVIGSDVVSNTQGIQSPEADHMIQAGASIAAESPQMTPLSTDKAMSIISEADAAIAAAEKILAAGAASEETQ